MNRVEALKIGKIIADRWWVRNQSTIRAQSKILNEENCGNKKSSLRRQANSEQNKNDLR